MSFALGLCNSEKAWVFVIAAVLWFISFEFSSVCLYVADFPVSFFDAVRRGIPYCGVIIDFHVSWVAGVHLTSSIIELKLCCISFLFHLHV
jgi:hypothetical protein